MTPSLSRDNENPVSRLTVATLDDLGYSVNYGAADNYDASHLSESCICNRRHLGQGNSSKGNSARLLNEREFNPIQQRAVDFGAKLLRSRVDTLFSGQRSASHERSPQTEPASTISVIYRNPDGSIDDVIVSV